VHDGDHVLVDVGDNDSLKVTSSALEPLG
jgi:hypothetical protein